MATPALIFDSLLDDGTLSASSEADNYPVANVTDWRVGTAYRWQASATSTPAYIDCDMGSGVTDTADTVVIGYHNLGDAGASYVIQYGTDGTSWTDANTTATATDNDPLVDTFSAQSARYWRIRIDATGTDFVEAPEIGIATLGERLELPYGPNASLDPYGEDADTEWNANDNGAPLGANLRAIGKRFRISYGDPGFATDDFFVGTSSVNFDDDFIPHARSNWFWFTWDVDSPAGKIWLTRVDGSIRVPWSGTTARRQLQMVLRGYEAG
jgi:hypothetical protein